MADTILHKYRRLIVNDVPEDRFIQLRYRLTPNEPFDLRGAAIRLLLILSQRTLTPLGFEEAQHADIDSLGAVVLPPGPPGAGNVTIALPPHVASRAEGLTQLLLLAGSAAEYNYASEIWLDDMSFPDSVDSWFAGPRHGVDGIRQMLGVHDRPLVGYVVKSRTRSSVTTLLESCWSALTGGVDLLVDDLLTTDPDGPLAFEKRVPAICELVQQFNAQKEEGSKAGYLVNIGASPWLSEEYLAKARAAGAFGCLVDCFTMGFGTVKELIDRAETQADDGPMAFFATNMGSGLFGRNPDDERLDQPLADRRFLRTGMSETLTAKLARLAGADGVHTGSVGSDCFEIAEYAHTPRVLRGDFDAMRPCFAIAEGDIQLTHVPDNILEIGVDLIIETTSGIANHPGGVEEGARSFRLLVACLIDDLRREDVDDVLNVLRDRYPKTIDPLLSEWKQRNDSRIRAGWSAEESARSLAALKPEGPDLQDLLRPYLKRSDRR